MKRHHYYAVIFVGTAPLGMSISIDAPPVTADDVLRLAADIRRKMMENAKAVRYPPVVILNLIPFGDSPAPSPGPAATHATRA